jgi:hypothetical protein
MHLIDSCQQNYVVCDMDEETIDLVELKYGTMSGAK